MLKQEQKLREPKTTLKYKNRGTFHKEETMERKYDQYKKISQN